MYPENAMSSQRKPSTCLVHVQQSELDEAASTQCAKHLNQTEPYMYMDNVLPHLQVCYGSGEYW